jgi:hypothetical protein
MFRKLTPLKYTDHGNLRLLPITDYGFARGELVAPVVIDEMADVAREYPIVFPKEGRLPVALMGLEKGANAYVSADGTWRATYVPMHIRHYPFAISRVLAPAAQGEGDAKGDDRFVVLIDEASPAVRQTEGNALFGGDGQLMPTAQQLLRMMEHMLVRAGVTERLVQAIEDAGLLRERAIRIKRDDAPDRQVAGIRVVDEAALNKMEDGAFNTLRKSGALPLVYASLLSWANFRQGPIGKSHPLPAASPAPDEDVIRFS